MRGKMVGLLDRLDRYDGHPHLFKKVRGTTCTHNVRVFGVWLCVTEEFTAKMDKFISEIFLFLWLLLYGLSRCCSLCLQCQCEAEGGAIRNIFASKSLYKLLSVAAVLVVGLQVFTHAYFSREGSFLPLNAIKNTSHFTEHQHYYSALISHEYTFPLFLTCIEDDPAQAYTAKKTGSFRLHDSIRK